MASLTSPFRIGNVEIANRVLLAPLAGIGNWFVRLQARRFGAGLAFSEMVSSFALKHGNKRTVEQMLVIHPDEHPVSIQLFGHDPDAMRIGAAMAAEAGADLIDINMGCPVKKVVKTGAGAALLTNPDLAVSLTRAASEGSGLPVTVKLRSGLEPGDISGLGLAQRLVMDGGASAIGFHPRPAAVQHQGAPDYSLARQLVNVLDVPVVLSGGLRTVADVHSAHEQTGADAVMIARGSLGYPWIFRALIESRETEPGRDEICDELLWVIDRADEHFGRHAVHYMRKHYAWYLSRLGLEGSRSDAFQRVESLDEVRAMVAALRAADTHERPDPAAAAAVSA